MPNEAPSTPTEYYVKRGVLYTVTTSGDVRVVPRFARIPATTSRMFDYFMNASA